MAVGQAFVGVCVICSSPSTFVSDTPGLRDSLACSGCLASGGSLPRERAVAWVLETLRPDWRSLRVHEFAPAGNALSRWLARECPAYSASHFSPDAPGGSTVRGMRNEDIHALTWGDECFDIALSLDVLEHITSPEAAIAEVSRVLRPDGVHLFTTPTYSVPETIRTARDLPEGGVEHLFEPEYHGSPNDPGGSLVYHRFGLDLMSCVREWSGRDCAVMRFDGPGIGVAGYFTDVYVNGALLRRASTPAPVRRWWGRG